MMIQSYPCMDIQGLLRSVSQHEHNVHERPATSILSEEIVQRRQNYDETVLQCWYGNLSIKDNNSLVKIVKVASKIGTNMNSLTSLHCIALYFIRYTLHLMV